MGTKLEAKVLALIIRQPYNDSLGYIVVGMDIDEAGDLEPAVGASAAIEGIHGGDPFIYKGGIWPAKGSDVVPNGSSFVTWPSM